MTILTRLSALATTVKGILSEQANPPAAEAAVDERQRAIDKAKALIDQIGKRETAVFDASVTTFKRNRAHRIEESRRRFKAVTVEEALALDPRLPEGEVVGDSRPIRKTLLMRLIDLQNRGRAQTLVQDEWRNIRAWSGAQLKFSRAAEETLRTREEAFGVVANYWNEVVLRHLEQRIGEARDGFKSETDAAYRTANGSVLNLRGTASVRLAHIAAYVTATGEQSSALADTPDVRALKSLLGFARPEPSGAQTTPEDASDAAAPPPTGPEPLMTRAEVWDLFKRHLEVETAAEALSFGLEKEFWKTAQNQFDDLIENALKAFQEDYVATFKAEEDRQSTWSDFRTRLATEKPPEAVDVPEGVFRLQIWRQRIFGSVRMVITDDGGLKVRNAKKNEASIVEPFTAWLSSSGAGSKQGNQNSDPPKPPKRDFVQRPETAAYIDWTSLPHRAVSDPIWDETSDVERDLLGSLHIDHEDTEDAIDDAIVAFAAELQGGDVVLGPKVDVVNLKRSAERGAVQKHRFRDVLEGPAVATIKKWRARMNAAGTALNIALGVDRAGFSAIVIKIDRLKKDDSLKKSELDAIAIVLSSLLKDVIDPSANFAGVPAKIISNSTNKNDQESARKRRASQGNEDSEEKPNDAFIVPTTLVHPLPLKDVHEIIADENAEGAVRSLLNPADLISLKVDDFKHKSPAFQCISTKLQSSDAILLLASRFGQAIDENLPHISGEDAEARDPNAGIGSESTALYRRMARHNLYSSIGMIAAFFLTIFAPVLFLAGMNIIGAGQDDLAAFRPELTITQTAILTVLFFTLTLVRGFGIYGIDRVIRNASDEAEKQWASVLRFNAWSEKVGMFLFRKKQNLWFGVSTIVIVGALLLWLPGFDFSLPKSTEENRLFIGVLSGALWAFPAISLTLLLQSANRFSTLVTDMTERTAELDVLANLRNLATTGTSYTEQMKRMSEGGKKSALSTLARRLPEFERALAAIKHAETSVKEEIEKSRQSYIRNSAATIAAIGIVAGFGPLANMKPDDPEKPVHLTSTFFAAGLNGNAPAVVETELEVDKIWNEETCGLTEGTDIVALDEWSHRDDNRRPSVEEMSSWASAMALRCQSGKLANLQAKLAPLEIEKGMDGRAKLALSLSPSIVSEDSLALQVLQTAYGADPSLKLPTLLKIGKAQVNFEKNENGEIVSLANLGETLGDRLSAKVPTDLTLGDWDVVLASLERQIREAQDAAASKRVASTDPDETVLEPAAELPVVGVRLRPEPWAETVRGIQQVIDDGQLDETGALKLAEDTAPEVVSMLTLAEWTVVKDQIEREIATGQGAQSGLRTVADKDRPKVEVGLTVKDGAAEKLEDEIRSILDSLEPELEISVGASPGLIPSSCAPNLLASFFFDAGATDGSAAASCAQISENIGAGSCAARTKTNLPNEDFETIAKRLSRDYEGRDLLVAGYADSSGDRAENMAISRERAKTVRQLLSDGKLNEVRSIWRGEEWIYEGPKLAYGALAALSRRVDVYLCDATRNP
ncbi:MAG: hypothetical protein AAFN79_20305 [Pseudomonadota bacterium]